MNKGPPTHTFTPAEFINRSFHQHERPMDTTGSLRQPVLDKTLENKFQLDSVMSGKHCLSWVVLSTPFTFLCIWALRRRYKSGQRNVGSGDQVMGLNVNSTLMIRSDIPSESCPQPCLSANGLGIHLRDNSPPYLLYGYICCEGSWSSGHCVNTLS